MRKWKIIPILLISVMFLTTCGNMNNTEREKEIENSETRGGEMDMTEVLKELVDRNYDCISRIFYYGYLSYDAESVVNDVAIVTSDEFATLEDLKRYLEDIYVPVEVERLLYDYFEGEPMYVDVDGMLAVDVMHISGAGMAVPWDSYSIEKIEMDGDKCSFAVLVKYQVGEGFVGVSEEQYCFQATLDEKWRLDRVVYLPETQLNDVEMMGGASE